MNETGLRRTLVRVMREAARLGLNTGNAGNASVRAGDGLLVTPTGIAPEALAPADIVALDFKGHARSARKPSSEWRFHCDILAARPEFGAVVHAHPPHATALACLGKPIPAFHYMVAIAGGADIRCGRYATFGTAALSRNTLEALDGRAACLLANHGLIACGGDADAALALAVEVETLARQYLLALAAGKPRILPPAEMARVLESFRTYGQQRPQAKAGPRRAKSGRS